MRTSESATARQIRPDQERKKPERNAYIRKAQESKGTAQKGRTIVKRTK